MAKKALLEVLESTIGRYLQNLDSETLSLSLWSGQIQLSSLSLNVSAVNNELARRAKEAPNLAAPFRVVGGMFDNVSLDVPWARLSSRPVVFRARGLCVEMEPWDFLSDSNNGDSNKSKAQEERLHSIQEEETARLRSNVVRMALENDDAPLDTDTSTASDSEKSSTFTSRLARRIIENLQFEIRDVHISIQGCGVQAGIVLGSLSLVTTDEKGVRTFVDRQSAMSSFLYKELEISGLGIYLQSETQQHRTQKEHYHQQQNREYVLSPLSFQAKLRQSDYDTCVDFPKYLVHSKLSSLSISLSRTQLELGHALAMAVRPHHGVRPLFPEYRPLVSVKADAREWWRYAVRCIGRLNRRRSWVEFYSAFQKRKVYVELYKRFAHAEGASWLSPLTPTEEAELKEIEMDRSISVGGLMHWRNLADGQVEREREKMRDRRDRSSVGSSTAKTGRYRLFGTPKKETTQQDYYQNLDDENAAPITLSADEMKELEELAMKSVQQVSTDSMLCDVNFTLGSFQVNLTTASRAPITSLEMDMVSTSFKAKADGSFAFGLSLLSLEVLDSVTVGTFYPTICRSLQKSHSTKQSHAFRLQLTKSKGGDQELVLKMVACEIVASPLLLFAVVEFFKLPVIPVGSAMEKPMLLETVSGEEDMFFDAREKESTMLSSSPVRVSTNATATPADSTEQPSKEGHPKDGKVSDKLSSAIVDAWNGKNQKKQHWTMDFDISAPILILPEDCVNANAAVLICNFGKFNFTYGSVALSPSVVAWFDAHQRANRMDSEIDHLKLEMNDLSFTISSVGDASKRGLEGLNRDISTSVISPISFTLDIGLEHTISSGDSTPRTCVIGVLPAIILRLAPSHVTKVLRVAGIWSSNLHKLRGDSQVVSNDSSASLGDVQEESDIEIMSSGSGISLLDADMTNENASKRTLLSKKDRLESMLLEKKGGESLVASEFMHVSLSLLRLSLNIYTSSGDGVEAHLVSVKASSSLSTDGSSSTRLCMGYFWILDRLESELKLPRRQRLVCHSNLPRLATVYAENDQYEAIMVDLTKQGVFASNYSGSADLADIHISKLPSGKVKEYHDNVTGFSQEYINYIREVEQVTIINAKFSSLFINWNPHAIKSLFAAKEQLLDFKQRAYSTYENISSTRQTDPKASATIEASDGMDIPPEEEESSVFIFAQMDTFEISLNSAKDDLPLFTLTMCDSKINRHEANEFNSEMDLVVGDLRIETPALGRTLDSYRTILGLAPSVSTSLLSLKYAKGSNAVSSCDVGGADKLECEACAVISLSPMRFVHLHSQVFTLIDYVSDGVFGAMAAAAMEVTAAAAMEVTKSAQNGERLFFIVASGFDFVLPRAAYSANYFVFHTGELEAHYRTLENETGSTAQVSLRDLSLSCDQQMPMVSNPVNLRVSVSMKPPLYQGTEDERATKIDMSTNRIRILLAQCHYAQIMHILDFNIGETNNFLRSDLSITRSLSTASNQDEKTKSLTETTVDSILKNLSHAGVQSIVVVKRMYINFNIQELSLELCGIDTEDPIVSIAAVNARLVMKLLPDEKQTRAYMTLHDLVCDDRRVGAHDRTFRRMVGRAGVNRCHPAMSPGAGPDDEDVFQVNYTKHTEDQSRLIEVKLGSSQVVVLPDVITDMLNFINVPTLSPSRTLSKSTSSKLSTDQNEGEMQVLVADDDPEAVEACFGERASVSLQTTNYRIDSSNMRLVLVDLGSIDSSGSFVTSKPTSTLTETIVLQGKMQASFDMTKDNLSGTTVEKDYKVDAQRVEIYTAQGADLLHPIQLLEPAKFSIFYYQNVGYNSSQHVTDFKFVTLTPIDVTVSMQNIALGNALANSISESFGSSDEDDNDTDFHSLSPTDAKRVSRLDSALAKDSDLSSHAGTEFKTDISVQSGKEIIKKKRVVKMKMTSPEATFTVTNDFQGLDEALFKVVVMNFVLGSEIDYPTGSPLEKPLFGFNTNTSILADYFDAASNRWETLLTDPWEITFNGSRSPQTRFDTDRMSTTFDIESNPCNVSFSEHFLVNVGAASRMWSVYSGAINKATALVEKEGKVTDAALRKSSKSMAAHAARSLITTLPYAIENHSGINAHYSIYEDQVRIPLPTSSTQFFQFELFPGKGSGGLRRYGQDIKHSKSLVLYVGSTEIAIHDMDREVNKSRSAHYISEYKTHVFTKVVKRGNSTVLHISSHVEVFNLTSLQFRMSLIGDDAVHDLGIIDMTRDHKNAGSFKSQSLLRENEELMTHSVFGLPAQFLRSFTVDNSETLCVQVSPVLEGDDGTDLVGLFNIFQYEQLVEMATSDSDQRIIEVSCHPVSQRSSSPHSSLAVNVRCKVSLVDDAHPFVQLSIIPRLILTNRLPIDIMLRTPMPHTFNKKESSQANSEDYRIIDKNFTIHEMKPLGSVEIFTPGPSIAISISCADLPIAGTATDWMDGGWLDVPLGSIKKLPDPVKLTFPFKAESLVKYRSRQVESFGKGSEFFVVEADDVTPDLAGERNSAKSKDSIRTVVVMVCNYAVDHTGNLLFEEVSGINETARRQSISVRSLSPPFSAFSSAKLRRRVSLLPVSSKYIRLVELTMDGEDGMKRSMPFKVDDVSMTEGIDSMPILWANNTPSGYFAYRNLTAEGAEIHVVPEFVVFNGSHHQIWVKQLSRSPFLLDSHKIFPISRDRNNSIVVQFEVPAINGLTGPVQIDQVGLRVVLAKSKKSGEALGSLAVQTVTGAKDSRLVIKIGALNVKDTQISRTSGGLFEHDFLRFRVRWSEMKVTLKDTEEENKRYEENRAAIRKYLEHHNVNSVEVEKRLAEARKEYNQSLNQTAFPDVAQIILHRFTVDFQRIFKEDEQQKAHGLGLPSNERSQFSIVIHNVRIKDCSPNTPSPNVFDSSSDKSFFDLCLRTRGPLNADLIRVDLFDLNLAYSDGKAEKITVNTGEDFVWRLLDIANRTMLATAELAGVDLDLKWNEETGKFSVSISDPTYDDLDSDGNYQPPRSDKLYDVKKLRVSPFVLLLSFKRQPQSSRYAVIRGVRGAKLTNYFTTRLKFTVDRAELHFQGYMVRDIKGPPDRLADTIKTVYITQLKTKMVTLMTATSIQDWKYLTARDSGGEEFIEGDLLRMTGNLAGRSAKFVLKKSGDFLGESVMAVTGAVGGGIQDVSETIGVGAVGAGVNSLVSGLGEGVSSTVKGVGTGAGDIVRGTGKGIGQVIGGIGGGAQLVAKGFGRGITTGDMSGVGQGFASMGSGVGQGVETVVEGTVSGVLSVGKGVFSGVKSVGKGIGGVFTGGQQQQRDSERKSTSSRK